MLLLEGGLYLGGAKGVTLVSQQLPKHNLTLRPLPFTDSWGATSQHADKGINLTALNTYPETSLPLPFTPKENNKF